VVGAQGKVVEKKTGFSRIPKKAERVHWSKWIADVEKEKRMGLTFQVADVKKPLIAVKRITEKGNMVSFGPGAEDNFILNKSSGDKLKLRPNGQGSYLLDVEFENGEKSSITVDSGAEESVCPWSWGSQFPVSKSGSVMRFRGAGGDLIKHHGQRVVAVKSPF
jgi:hypothetical protein